MSKSVEHILAKVPRSVWTPCVTVLRLPRNSARDPAKYVPPTISALRLRSTAPVTQSAQKTLKRCACHKFKAPRLSFGRRNALMHGAPVSWHVPCLRNSVECRARAVKQSSRLSQHIFGEMCLAEMSFQSGVSPGMFLEGVMAGDAFAVVWGVALRRFLGLCSCSG